MSSIRNTHWCHRCQRAVWLRARDAVCSYCGGGFVEEIDIGPSRAHRDVERDPTFDLMEAFSAFMRSRLAERSYDREISGRLGSAGSESFSNLAPLLIFGGQAPFRLAGGDNSSVEAFVNGAAPGIGIARGTNAGDYFFGPGLEELIEQLSSGTHHRGPPPAPKSSIDALPTIKITQKHLKSSDSHCPVCKDDITHAQSVVKSCHPEDLLQAHRVVRTEAPMEEKTAEEGTFSLTSGHSARLAQARLKTAETQTTQQLQKKATIIITSSNSNNINININNNNPIWVTVDGLLTIKASSSSSTNFVCCLVLKPAFDGCGRIWNRSEKLSLWIWSFSVNESLFVMGKNTVEEQNLPVSDGAASARNNGGGGISTCCCCDWISSYFSLRCVLILAFSAAVFLSALFWLPPFLGFADPGDLDLDPRFKDHRIVASFDVGKPISFMEDNLMQLENDITDEISFPMTKVVVLALERLGDLNRTMVIFAIDPEKENSKIPAEIESLIKAAFETLVQKQLSFRLTESLFGEPFFFEVLKFPGGITVIPPQPIFPLQKAQLLFNFTLNFSIYQIQSNFEELASQLKKGINLASYERFNSGASYYSSFFCSTHIRFIFEVEATCSNYH
ncbi:putative protein [Arabidopsis thaliana]|nr:putative protein [Arabidopsis thaliana]